MSTSPNPALSMITLCNISYKEKFFIPFHVQEFDPGLNIVWGPEECFIPTALESVALMYIVQGAILSDGSGAEYTVVIRGTNFTSWTSWKNEDFALSPPVPFNTLVPDAPSTAVISTGANNGINYLNSLEYEHHLFGKKYSAIDFFKEVVGVNNIAYLNVAGHSLGGGLVPPYFTYLCYSLFGGPQMASTTAICTPFSFAGPTTGNADFCSFFETYLYSGLNSWRYVNKLDIAPNCWWSFDNIDTIYRPWRLNWRPDEASFVINRFSEVPPPPDKYEHPLTGEVPMKGYFHDADAHAWILQVLHQHHSGTYMELVAGL